MAHASGLYFCPSQITRALPSRPTKRSTGAEFDVVLDISSPAPSADQSTVECRGQSLSTTSRTAPPGSDINRILPSCSPNLTTAGRKPLGERLQFAPPPVSVILATSCPFPLSGSKEKNVVVPAT